MAIELEVWAGRLAHELRELAALDQEAEAGQLLRIARRYAPGRLGTQLRTQGAQVVSDVPGAQLLSEGGTIRPKRARWLLIPLPGRPKNVGQGPNYVTIGKRADIRYVIDRQTKELVAVRKLSVTIRGSRWMDKALEEHTREAEQRLARDGERRLTELR
jgi:hypothetical protein